MRAVDTNIVARFVLGDDAAQSDQAAAILSTPVWIAMTVWLELGWVLGKRLAIDRATVAELMATVLALDTVHCSDRDGLAWAIDRYREGADWGDVLHLVMARGIADTFVTFDRAIAPRAGGGAPLPIETLG